MKTYPKVTEMRSQIREKQNWLARLAWAEANPMPVDCPECTTAQKARVRQGKPAKRSLRICPHPTHHRIDSVKSMYDAVCREEGTPLPRRCHVCNRLPDDPRDFVCPACRPAKEAKPSTAPSKSNDDEASNAVAIALGLDERTRRIAREEIAEVGGLDVSNELDEIKRTGATQTAMMEDRIAAKLAELDEAKSYLGITFRSLDDKEITLKGHYHEAFAEAFDIMANSPNGVTYLVGPAGTGKTHMAEQLSKAWDAYCGEDYGFACDSLNEGTPESYFTGWLLPTGEGGRFIHHETGYTRSFESGGVYAGDEFDRMDANVASILNRGLDADSVDVPKRVEAPRMMKHKHHRFVAIGNTVGAGASSLYAACNQQDGATMNRFGGQMVHIGYDEKLEGELALAAAGGDRSAANQACALIKDMRAAIERHDLQQIASYRQTRVCAGQWARANALRKDGKDVPKHLTDDAIKARCLASWSPDEVSYVA